MDTSTFHGSKKRSVKRYTTLSKAQMEAEDCENPITSIIILRPRAGF